MYLSTGDNATPFDQNNSKYKLEGYGPIDNREGFEQWDARRSSANTNDLRGKVLRIIVNKDGSYDQFLKLGVIPTNCVFSGADLYMTDAGVLADSSDPSMGGQLWLLRDVTEGLGTWPGSINL